MREIKSKIVKLQQKLEASQRKIEILRSYNVELEAAKKLKKKFFKKKSYLNCVH